LSAKLYSFFSVYFWITYVFGTIPFLLLQVNIWHFVKLEQNDFLR